MEKNSSQGIGVLGVLTLIFVGLKLGKVINWSWIWVLSPLWIGAIFTIVILILVLAITVLDKEDDDDDE